MVGLSYPTPIGYGIRTVQQKWGCTYDCYVRGTSHMAPVAERSWLGQWLQLFIGMFGKREIVEFWNLSLTHLIFACTFLFMILFFRQIFHYIKIGCSFQEARWRMILKVCIHLGVAGAMMGQMDWYTHTKSYKGAMFNVFLCNFISSELYRLYLLWWPPIWVVITIYYSVSFSSMEYDLNPLF